MVKRKSKRENEWKILVGGDAEGRLSLARKAHDELIRRCDSSLFKYDSLKSRAFREKDLKGFDGIRRERLLLGNIDNYADIPEDVCGMLQNTKGELEFLYWDNSNVLFLNNFTCEDTQRLKLLLSFLEGIRRQGKGVLRESGIPMTLGELILGLEKKDDLKVLTKLGYEKLFKVEKLRKALTGKLKRGRKQIYISDKELKPLLNGILIEFKRFSYSLKDLAEIAEKQIQTQIKNKDSKFYGKKRYGISRLKTFFCNLRKGRPLRYKSK